MYEQYHEYLHYSKLILYGAGFCYLVSSILFLIYYFKKGCRSSEEMKGKHAQNIPKTKRSVASTKSLGILVYVPSLASSVSPVENSVMRILAKSKSPRSPEISQSWSPSGKISDRSMKILDTSGKISTQTIN